MKRYQGFLLAIAIGLLAASFVVGPVLTDDTVVQDDFRQSMFWVWRFWDPELFPNDFIASVYSGGFDRLPLLWIIYKIAPAFTGSLVGFTKFAAIILAGFTTAVGYLFYERLSERQAPALAFALLLATTLWCTDHLSAMYARSFIWICVLLVMWLKQAGKDWWASLATLASLFISPIAFLICFAIEGFDLILNKRDQLFEFGAKSQSSWLVINAAVVLLVYKVLPLTTKGLPFADSEWYTTEELKTLPEFLPGGRHPIFGSSLWDGSWWNNEHWGLGIGFLKISNVLLWALGLALLYLVVYRNKHKIEGLFTGMPACLLYSSLALYVAAQVLFPLLYMPSRFLGIPLLLVSLITLVTVSDFILSDVVDTFLSKYPAEKKVYLTSTLLMLVASVYWFHFSRPQNQYTRYVKMNKGVADIYRNLPKDAMIAGHPLLPDINLASAIAKRSVFMSYEHSTPSFNKQVLAEVRRRNVLSLKMVYASSAGELRQMMKDNKVTHVVAHLGFYDPAYLARPSYIEPYMGLLRQLAAKKKFFLKDFLIQNKVAYALFTERTFELMEKKKNET
ncbi:MAG: hypothetical protein OXU45_01000 [Candidatus Melainabacteria bacterium]|nr:hypothetical protein [Candidatus Melainabacteria bacterium]